MSQSPGISYALYGLWVVGILLMVATVLLPWVAGLFEGDMVSADVSYSMWRYLRAVGLLLSWLASFHLLRQGDNVQRLV